ncbi:MAG: hypothetical protein A2Y03_04135 [Omnitrophica WOR_2 bacterium GWF2_38_59]|nr:MAG: hypothetical protein A2Y06_05440 [Omnitrophica WOR_2 bacterium GWA2_37_7]OGX25568.1 MAG: hypothetical protein A2Y03_04135 [Omnitrophica WOR_2 bacterium GWF2_38_59]OGX50187.1 MAG: hypothetical protein A2243_08615 [Omnitrophica WOR_2 bacterium RIFOXYA2_FULL_38_17]OGX52813.1 MAG: hypothetical protein A2267_07640 [Omnitrophica WOR_2 bacterium RIFOXYA12_FULL_38_10]OGX57445.1 MAG: hypothetical protein A2306_02965 [Omnitrophica WOR_2 bacterium RIFOXYB2_FULL_38_16]OGX57499.1 MAG: hypothetical 
MLKITKNLVIIDLETTGVWIEQDKIIEIAMIKCLPSRERLTYDKRVNPEMNIPKIVTDLTGISNEDISNSPKFREIVNEVLEFIGDADLAGFNVERFDLPLLKREIEDAGLKFDWQNRNIYDAQKVYHINEKRDLSAAYEFYCKKNLENAHSALADTTATLEILEAQIEKYCSPTDGINALSEFNYRNNVEFYDEEGKFRWWNGKLYMMFGKYAKKYTIQEIAKRDKGYLEWISSANFSSEIKDLADKALQGKFPVYPNEKP